MNISISPEQAAEINGEVRSGHYTSASEFIRELIRERNERKAQADAREFERLSAGLWERDTTPQEEASILRHKRKVRAELQAERANGMTKKARRA